MTNAGAKNIVDSLSKEEKAAMLSMVGAAPGWRDAVKTTTHWMVEIDLREKGLIGFSRSGDNACWLTDLGIGVRDLLQAQATA